MQMAFPTPYYVANELQDCEFQVITLKGKGKMTDGFRFTVRDTKIPSVSKQTVKSLCELLPT